MYYVTVTLGWHDSTLRVLTHRKRLTKNTDQTEHERMRMLVGSVFISACIVLLQYVIEITTKSFYIFYLYVFKQNKTTWKPKK